MRKILLCIFYACVLILFSVKATLAQVEGNPKLGAANSQHPEMEKSSIKLSADLKELYDNASQAQKSQSQTKPVLPNDGLGKYLQIRGDMVLVDITVKGNTNTARIELEKIGFKVTAVFGRVISGRMPINALQRLESATNVKFARPAYKPMHQSKPISTLTPRGMQANDMRPVISQGDTAQRSYIARTESKVNGRGVKVGILSDSYNNLGTADIGVMRGELPGPGNPFNFNQPVEVLKDLDDSSGIDEGRAMAEIVHDVAPGSQIAFHTAFDGQADFAQGILDLAMAGCKVITDDVLYYAEPFFQDGIIAQAVDLVKKKGVAYFSAAGNESRRSYESDYRPSQFTPFGPGFGTAHNFSAPSDPPVYFQPIFIPTGGLFITSFQWDQPFFSAGGAGAESDLDIYLLDAQGRIVALGFDDNILSGDPVEVIGYFNSTASTTFFLAIVKYSGPDPSQLKYILYGDALFFFTTPAIPGILAPTIVGHPKAEGAIAIAAVPFFRTPAYGVNPPVVEGFSSVGGTPHYFDTEGNRIAPLIRKKPEITAPDGGNTSFFPPFPNQDIMQDSDTFPNFFGTSAAAPHAAGIAALMVEAQKLKTITPDQIRGVLEANTIDMDDTGTPGFDIGFDFKTGTGLIKADAAVKEVRFPNLYVKDLDLQAICSDDPATTRNWKIINPNPFAVEAQWFLTGFPQQGHIVVPPGETTFSTNTAYYYNRPVPNIVILSWEDNFGFPHFDLAYSTRAECGVDIVSEKNDDKTLVGTLDAELINKQNTAEVYPNPTSKNFRLYLSLANQQNTELELYGIDGKILYKKSVQANGIIDIDASTYKPGIYILKVKQREFNKTFKLIKK